MVDAVDFSNDDGILTAVLSNPGSANALTPNMSRQLERGLSDAERDPTVRVIVLAGANNAFCSGADVKAMTSPDPEDPLSGRYFEHPVWNGLEHRAGVVRHANRLTRLVWNSSKPVIAQISGGAAGAGLALALATDFRFAADDATLATGYARLGASGDLGIGWLLSRLVGRTTTRELLFFSDRVKGAEAQAIGLVDKAMPAADLDDYVRTYARRLADGPPVAFQYIKRNLRFADTASLEDYMEYEANNMARCFMTRDSAEAIQALTERRKPNFEGY